MNNTFRLRLRLLPDKDMSNERNFSIKKGFIALILLFAAVALLGASRFASQAQKAAEHPQQVPVWDFTQPAK